MTKHTLLIFSIALGLSFLPVLYSIYKTPTGFFPTAVNQFYDANDVFTYLPNIRLGIEKQILFSYKFYPPVLDQKVLMYLPQTLTGFALGLLNLPLPIYYQTVVGYYLLRILTSIFLFGALIYLLNSLKFSQLERLVAVVIFFLVDCVLPVDFPGLFPEASLQVASYGLDIACMMLAVGAFVRRLDKGGGYLGTLAIALTVMTGTHPYNLVPVSLLFFVTTLLKLKGKGWCFAVGTLLTTLPATLLFCYYLCVFYFNDLLAWSALYKYLRVYLLSPTPIKLLVIYGAELGLIIAFIYSSILKRHFLNLFLLIWLGLQLIMIYLPFIDQQRAQAKGLGVVMVLICTLALTRYVIVNTRLKAPVRIMLASAFFILGTHGYLVSIYIPLQLPSYSGRTSLYISQNKMAALNYLDKNKGDVGWAVLTFDRVLSQMVPAATGLAVSNGYFTPNEEARNELIAKIFNNTATANEITGFITDDRIGYLISSAAQPLNYSFLENIYQNREVLIYKVT
jgi:hypothetical protein